jgi:hypothetical protein
LQFEGFVSGHRFSDAAKGDSSERLYSLLKNSSFDFVLKGRGFQPRRKCHKINPALAAEAPPQSAMPLFSANCLAAGAPITAQRLKPAHSTCCWRHA